MARSLFVTNDALSGHIGTAQVLPYIEGLSALGNDMQCISVEPDVSVWDLDRDWKRRIAAAQASHFPIRRHSDSLYAFERFTIATRLSAEVNRVILAKRPDILHCRSYAPLGAALSAKARHKIPFLFDMRGFWIDQRIEGGAWNLDRWFWRQVVRRLRKVESRGISEASGIVTLTEQARETIIARPDYTGTPVLTIPCSVRGDIFYPRTQRQEVRDRLGINAQSRVIAYLGSAGGLYRMDVVFRLWNALVERGLDAALLFIGDHSYSARALEAEKAGINLDPARTFFTRCPHHQIPEVLSCADIGVSPIIQSFSSIGVSATKVGEYLSCGIPVVTNDGVGDSRRIVQDGSNGYVLPDFEDVSIARCAQAVAAGWAAGFLPATKIASNAQAYFGMRRALDSYNDLYSMVVEQGKAL